MQIGSEFRLSSFAECDDSDSLWRPFFKLSTVACISDFCNEGPISLCIDNEGQRYEEKRKRRSGK